MYRVSKINGKYVPELHSEVIGWLYMQMSSHEGELLFWKSSKYLKYCLLDTEEAANKVIDAHIKHVLNSIKYFTITRESKSVEIPDNGKRLQLVVNNVKS